MCTPTPTFFSHLHPDQIPIRLVHGRLQSVELLPQTLLELQVLHDHKVDVLQAVTKHIADLHRVHRVGVDAGRQLLHEGLAQERDADPGENENGEAKTARDERIWEV